MKRKLKMKKISVDKIRRAVSALCIKANTELRRDVLLALKKALRNERNKRAKRILEDIIKNAGIAKKTGFPICQDTGMAVVYCEIGQGVSFTDGDLTDAINKGVRDGYRIGYGRKSVVEDPILRGNTGTNTPAVIHVKIVPGNKVRITVCPKGFGSENKSTIKMLNPTASVKDIKNFLIDTIKDCGADACPPLILGVGIGGTFEKAAELAKSALLIPLNKRNSKKHLEKLEKELLDDINRLNIGPMGLGGRATALGVKILDFPTHIAGLPVAVCVSCHATRSAEKIL